LLDDMTKLRRLLVLLATLVVPLSGCGGESRRAGALHEQATDGGDASAVCSSCDGGPCVEGLCCNDDLVNSGTLDGEPCRVAGEGCGPGDCSESDGGVITCGNGSCSSNYFCRSDDTGGLHWVYQRGHSCIK
jgi:hypothetical protein